MKTKQFLLASAFVAMLMVFLGSCEQLTDTGSDNTGGGATVTAPAVPENVEATASSATEIAVTWDSVTGADEYEVYFGEAVVATEAEKYGTTSETTSMRIVGLTASTKYYVWVKAVNADGEKSDFSDVANATTESSFGGGGTAPVAPSNVDAEATSSSEVAVTWDSVSDADEYTVYYKKSASADTDNYTTAGTTTRTSYTVQSLSPNTLYRFYVTATKSNVESDYSLWDFTRTEATPEDTLPAPTGLSATSPSSGEISLSWNRVSGATEYDIFYSTSPYSSSATKHSYSPTTTSFDLNGATPDETYYLWVKAKNSTTTSAFSSRVSVTVKEEENTLPATTYFSATSSSPGKISLRWNGVSGATEYEIFYSRSPSSNSATKHSSTTSTSSTITVSAGTYYLWIKAKNSTATSDFSSMRTVTVEEEVTPLQLPDINQTLEDGDNGTRKLTEDGKGFVIELTQGDSRVEEYKLYRATSEYGTPVHIKTLRVSSGTQKLGFEDSGVDLTEGNKYYYTVYAVYEGKEIRLKTRMVITVRNPSVSYYWGYGSPSARRNISINLSGRTYSTRGASSGRKIAIPGNSGRHSVSTAYGNLNGSTASSFRRRGTLDFKVMHSYSFNCYSTFSYSNTKGPINTSCWEFFTD